MSRFVEEYDAVRKGSGIYIINDEAVLAISGADRFSWLQGMVSSDVRRMENGESTLHACILNNTGHLLSDAILYNVSANDSKLISILPDEGCILMILPAPNVEKISRILERFIIMEDVEIANVTSRIYHVSNQGPESVPYDGYLSFPNDRSGSGGYDLFAEEKNDLTLFGTEISQETQNLLRIEAGIPKYGVDMDERTIPIETNLEATHISLNKGCYVGQEIIARINSRGHTNRRLVGLVVESGEISPGDELISSTNADKDAGTISSTASNSPALQGKTIALATVRNEFAEIGNTLYTKTSGSLCTVHELPFYRNI